MVTAFIIFRRISIQVGRDGDLLFLVGHMLALATKH